MEFDLGKVKGEDGVTPELMQTLGDDADKTMSQRAITDQFTKFFTGVGVSLNGGGFEICKTDNRSAFFIFAAYEKDTQNYVIAVGIRPDGIGSIAIPKYTIIASNVLSIAGAAANGNISVKNYEDYNKVRSICYYKVFEE